MSELVINASEAERVTILDTVQKLGPELGRCFASTGIVIHVLARGQRFADVAKSYRTADALDYGICQGLYDPHKREIVLRTVRPDIVAHELLHHVDHIAGDDKRPRSQLDPDLKAAFFRRKKDGCAISAYSLTNPTEFTAEALRAACGFSVPRPASRKSDFERIQLIDPQLATMMQTWLAEARAAFA